MVDLGKTSTSALLTMLKPLTVYYNKLWEILQDLGIPVHLTNLLQKLYAGNEATVTIGLGITDWFKTGKKVCQGCLLSPCLFNLHA